MASAAHGRGRAEAFDALDVTNFRLGPRYAQWLVGPIAHIADDDERAAYLTLSEDTAAEAFIEAFWERRGPNRLLPPSGPRTTFESRAEEADARYSEGTMPGRRSDRGTIHILYGPPAEIEYASSPTPGGAPIEVWVYPKRSEPGLDGRRPRRRYAFRKQGRVTEFVPLSAVRELDETPRLGRRRPPGG